MQLKKHLIFILIVIISLLSLSCTKTKELKKHAVLFINGRSLNVEIAATDKERQKGLMYRDKLDENEGMVFVFEKKKILDFWMKNTSIPLSIAFLDKNGNVVDIFNMTPYSLEPVTSTKRCNYAVEVNMGFFKRCGLKVGDKIDLSGIYKK